MKDMYKLSVIAVGKLKEPFWRDAVREYEKRLSPFAKVRVIEVPDIPFRSAAEAPATLAAEARTLRKALPKNAFVIALAKEGRALSSEAFAEFLRREGEGGRETAFVIGGPLGLDAELAREAQAVLSLSSLTFTHGEARAVLFEQLYRAMTILAGKSYHY